MIKCFLSILGLFLFVFSLKGCAHSNIAYEKVNIPIRCDIEMPIKPDLEGETFLPNKIKNLLIYAEALEYALNFCIKGDSNE